MDIRTHIEFDGPGREGELFPSLWWILVGGTLIVSILVLIFGTVIYVTTGARAQEHRHSVADVPLHEKFYKDWMQPPARTISCCNKQDCYPTTIKQDEDGHHWALRREDGAWIKIPAYMLEQNQGLEENIRQAPDHQSHVCMQPPGFGDSVYCATIGTGQ